ncbi:MAG: copper homeostasis protein CutC [Crocinitomicaceae bacterium]
MLLEACVDNLNDGIKAFEAGANRIEFCSRLDQDGLTPDFDQTMQLIQHITIPVRVMIRCRSGNFNYSAEEINWMIKEIEQFKALSIEGFVFGCLTDKNEIDYESTTKLVEAATPLPVTFHKAIDQTGNLLQSLKSIKMIKGIDTILTSGGEPTALEGVANIAQLVSNADHLTILVAGKVDQSNIRLLSEKTGSNAFHGRKIME